MRRVSDKIQIWQVLNSPHVGGGEILAFAINDYLSRETDIKGGLIVPDYGDSFQYAQEQRVPYRVYRFDALSGKSTFNATIENIRLSLQSWNRRAILHFHSPFTYGCARLMRKLTRLRSIVHIHLDYSEQDLQWPLKAPPDTLIGCADFVLRNAVRVLGPEVNKTKLHTVLNAIDVDRFKPVTQYTEHDHSSGEPIIITMLANIAPHKGQHTAISAVKLIHDKGIPIELWLAGEERGSSEHTLYLKQQAAKLGIEQQVKFLGFRSDIVELLETTDYLVLPSTSEGLPLSLLEAHAAGVITLASPTAGVPELITDNENGFLIGAEDYHGYAHKIMNLIKSPVLRSEIRAKAWQRLHAKHKSAHYFKQITDIYREMLSKEQLKS